MPLAVWIFSRWTLVRWTLVEARYHFECHRNFTSSTRQHTPHKIQRGHPVSVVAQSAFDDLCDELLAFGKNELFTVANLHEKLTMLARDRYGAQDHDVYSVQHLRNKLREIQRFDLLCNSCWWQ